MKQMRTRAMFSLTVLLACCACTFALNPSLDVSQYAHTSWKVRDSFTRGRIQTIAQTPDGYLWLGTEFGLYRFDGIRAVLWQPPPGQQLPASYIRELMVSREGTLWIGTTRGLASWRNEQLTRYPEISESEVSSLLEDREGTVWVGEWQSQPQGRLCAVRNGAVECYGTDGRLGWGALRLLEDSGGNLWVLGGGPPNFGFWRWRPGAPKFYSIRGGANCFAENSDGGLLLGTPQGLMRMVEGKLEPNTEALPRSMRGLLVSRLQRDREGALWIGILGGGLVHVHSGRGDVFTQSDGLSSNQIHAFFQDREGNMWVGTTEGLDRFRNFTIPTWSARQGLPFAGGAAVLARNDGTIWAGAITGLAKLDEAEVTIYRQRPQSGSLPASYVVRERIDRNLPQGFGALLEDRNGRLWISSANGIGYLEGEQFHPIPPFGTRIVLSMAEDPTGDIWLEDQENGLFRIRDGRVTQQIPWDKMVYKDRGRSLAVDRLRGGLWIGFVRGGMVYLKDGRVRESYSVSDGLGEGKVNDVRFGPRGTLWAATGGGLSRIRDGRVLTLTSENGLPCDTVHWSIEDNDHFVWLYMTCGLVRIARSDLDVWASDPKRKVQATVFDASDGVRTMARLGGYFPQATKAPDGKIWFSGVDGVGVIDPRHLPYNKLPPPVHIEQVTADRHTYSAASDGEMRLPPLVRDLEIDYTALSFVLPEKVRFRYRLEGFDRDWQEAGNRRQTFYSNLPPRSYRFRVIASNNSGVWNEEGTFLDFSIAPAYYQTKWFQALCLGAFVALLWAFYRFRLYQIQQQFDAGLEARVNERARIARELHDTLLQSFQGLVFRFQAARNQLPDRPEEASETLDSALVSADRALEEGRSSIQELRSEVLKESNMEEVLLAMGRELASSKNGEYSSPPLRVIVEGTRRAKRAMIREEIYRIARELLRNAYRHAHARSIEVELRYDDDAFVLIVRDDGKGIDTSVLKGRGRSGHWGLPGMYERAEGIGARLDVWSEAGAGTEVRLTVPGVTAYEKSGRGGRFELFRKNEEL